MMQQTFSKVHINVKLIQCSGSKLLVFFVPNCCPEVKPLTVHHGGLVKPLIVPTAIHVPGAVDIFVVLKRHFQLRLARLMITVGTIEFFSPTCCHSSPTPPPQFLSWRKNINCMLGSRNFARYWNVSLLRLRLSTLRCQRVKGARQHREY